MQPHQQLWVLFTDTFSSPQNWDQTTGEELPCWEKEAAFPSEYSRCSVTLNPKSGWGWGGRGTECFLRWFFELCHGKKNPFTWFIYSVSSSKEIQISCIRKKNPRQLQHSQNFKGYVKERLLNPCTSEFSAHTTVSLGQNTFHRVTSCYCNPMRCCRKIRTVGKASYSFFQISSRLFPGLGKDTFDSIQTGSHVFLIRTCVKTFQLSEYSPLSLSL